MGWTNEPQPFGQNRAPLLAGLSVAGDGTAVPVAVDPATGAILTAPITGDPTRSTIGDQHTSISNNSETTIVTADAAHYLDLYALILTNTSGTATTVTIKDSTSGTTKVVIEVPATDTRGMIVGSNAGLKQTAKNNNWTATCSTGVSTLEVTAMYTKSP